jgi:PPE-repeat protein
MFAGPGSGPLLAAAAAWDALASELASSAASFRSVTQDLATGSWLGPSSAAMMAVASQYAAFLSQVAAQAEQAAGQASIAAAAFEAALATIVQPAVVAANRGLMQVLAATNFLGQNAPAIADIEAAYEQMWALDVAAMSGYHSDASAAAQRLQPWRNMLRALGRDRSSHPVGHRHHHIVGAPGVGDSNLNSLENALSGTGSTDSNSTSGPGNAGGQSGGYASTGSSNAGFGNANIGSGNTGISDTGFGLTGNHEVSFGGLNWGSGNIGFGNSATANIGLLNSGTANVGIGHSGSFNTGLLSSGTGIDGAMNTSFLHPGLAGPGFAAPSPDASLLNSGNYVTGGLNAANLGSSAGGFNPGFANSDVFNAAPANPAFTSPANPAAVSTGAFDAGTPSPSITSAANGQNATTPLLRTTPPSGLFNAASNDSGLRNAGTGDSGIGDPGAEGIPSSGFFRSDPIPALANPAISQTDSSE